ncbi:MAG: hypothetical protein IKZ03_06715 [Clostridia bacterium]|nr:hypothetical protein [Clostridia bacterium]
MKKGKRKLTGGETVLIIVNLLWMLGLYYGCIFLGERMYSVLPYQICTGLFAAAAILLVAFSAYLSGKLVSKKQGEERTPAQIELSRKLMLWAVPLIAVLLIDIIDLFVVEYFREMLSYAVENQQIIK